MIVLLLLLPFLLYACGKKETVSPVSGAPADSLIAPVDTTSPPVTDSFITYAIPKGANYCTGNRYPPGNFAGMRFRAIFDSSCIYTTADPANQADINKLMGFADCNSFHQQNSARFGWNWEKGALRIHAYCYVNGQRTYRELGTVSIGAIGEYEIRVLPGAYIFRLNGAADTLARGCTDSLAAGYKLYPYFGGDEPAPHEVRIRVMEE